jgi:hypothetical protein
LTARETVVDARAASADATMAVVEAFATGAVEIEPDSGKVIDKSREAGAFLARAQRDPVAASKAMRAFREAYARLAAAAQVNALAAARAAVASATEKVATMFADLVALRDRMVAALPTSLRAAFQDETREQVRDAKRALGALGEAASAASNDPPPTRDPDAR